MLRFSSEQIAAKKKKACRKKVGAPNKTALKHIYESKIRKILSGGDDHGNGRCRFVSCDAGGEKYGFAQDAVLSGA